jgi:hypothetical protein
MELGKRKKGKMWVKTGWLTNFIDTGGIKLPPDVQKFIKDDVGSNNWNRCPFCDNFHKKYTVFKLHPASLGGKSIELYVCKDCRNVIEREDPIILEHVEDAIRDWDDIPEDTEIDEDAILTSMEDITRNRYNVAKNKKFIEGNKSIDKNRPYDEFDNDYFRDMKMSVYLRDFLEMGYFPEHTIEYTYNKTSKCLWCNSPDNLQTLDVPVGLFDIILDHFQACSSCTEMYYDILDRRYIPNKFVSESCVKCKAFYFVKASIYGDRLLNGDHNKHYCYPCLVKAGLDTQPIMADIKCKGCHTIMITGYDLTAHGQYPSDAYCMKCAEEFGNDENLDEKEIEDKLNRITIKRKKDVDVFGEYNDKAGTYDIPKISNYSRKLYSKKYKIYTVIFFAKAYPSNSKYCYFRIEEGVSEEEEGILRTELDKLEYDVFLNEDEKLSKSDTLLAGMVEEEYGFVTVLYSSYQEDNIIFKLDCSNEEAADRIFQCVQLARKRAKYIVDQYDKRVRLTL